MAFTSGNRPCFDSADVEAVLHRLEVQTAVVESQEDPRYPGFYIGNFLPSRHYGHPYSFLLNNEEGEIDDGSSFVKGTCRFDLLNYSTCERKQVVINPYRKQPFAISRRAAASPNLPVTPAMRDGEKPLTMYMGFDDQVQTPEIRIQRSSNHSSISNSSEFELDSSSSAGRSLCLPDSFADGDAHLLSHRPPNVCRKHPRTKITRLRPLHSLATGRRKFRCETCTSILLRWVEEHGATATGHRRARLLSMVGLNGSQLDNWLTNKRRAQRRERSRNEHVSTSSRS